jgi:hypothetical protein
MSGARKNPTGGRVAGVEARFVGDEEDAIGGAMDLEVALVRDEGPRFLPQGEAVPEHIPVVPAGVAPARRSMASRRTRKWRGLVGGSSRRRERSGMGGRCRWWAIGKRWSSTRARHCLQTARKRSRPWPPGQQQQGSSPGSEATDRAFRRLRKIMRQRTKTLVTKRVPGHSERYRFHVATQLRTCTSTTHNIVTHNQVLTSQPKCIYRYQKFLQTQKKLRKKKATRWKKTLGEFFNPTG